MAKIPVTEPSADGHSPQGQEEKNVGSKPEGIVPQTTLGLENGNVVDSDRVEISAQDSDASSTNIFSDPVVAAHYVDVDEKAHYECRHVFDPDLEWTKKEEKVLLESLTGMVCPLANPSMKGYFSENMEAYFNDLQSVLGLALCSLHCRLTVAISLKPLPITCSPTCILQQMVKYLLSCKQNIDSGF